MSEARALYEVFSRPTYRAEFAKAKAQKTCILCGGLSVRFRDFSGKFEYAVSALSCYEAASGVITPWGRLSS